jgi:hypothetical protein
MTAAHRPDIASIARITLVAWQKRYAYTQERYQRRATIGITYELEPPSWIIELRRNFDLPDISSADTPESMSSEPVADASQLLPQDFGFDTMDWSFWADP